MELRLSDSGADVELMNGMLNGEALWWLIDNDPEQILGWEYCREFVPPLTIYTFTLSDAIRKYQAILRGDPGWQNWEVVTISNKWKEMLATNSDGSPPSM